MSSSSVYTLAKSNFYMLLSPYAVTTFYFNWGLPSSLRESNTWLTSSTRSFWEYDSCSAGHEVSRIFWNPNGQYPTHRARDSILGLLNPVQTPTSYSFRIRFTNYHKFSLRSLFISFGFPGIKFYTHLSCQHKCNE